MDPLSIIAGAGQIITFCASTTTTIARWSIDVRTADERITGFCDEIRILEKTYSEMRDVLITPALGEAAKASYETEDGRRLWNAVLDALEDSKVIMAKVVGLLDKINKTSGIMRRPRMQFEESIRKGELGTLRERLKYFNSNISLSIQMVTCMTQQEHKAMTQMMQRDLDMKFHRLESLISDVRYRLDRPTSEELRGSTLVVGSVDGSMRDRGKDNYFDFAKRFVTNASAVASTRSNLSTISPPIEPTPRFHGGVVGSTPIARRETIAQWASDVNVSVVPESQAENALAMEQMQAKRRAEERNYKLCEAYLRNGPEKSKGGAHESAEKNFRSALAILAKHDFSGRISYHPAEIVLMLTQSCLKQQKYDDCIAMLQRVCDREDNIFPPNITVVDEILPVYHADILQSLAACHLMADALRQKGTLEEAKDYAMRAYDARTDTLGESDEKTIESLELLIQIHRDLGDEETADAYGVFLEVQPSNASILSAHEEIFSEAPTAITVPTASPPSSEIALPTERPSTSQPKTGRFKSMFGRPSVSSLHEARPWTDPPMQQVKRHTTDLSAQGVTPIVEPTSPKAMARVPTRETKEIRRVSTSEIGSICIDPVNASFEDVVENVRSLCMSGKQSKAIKVGLERLERYNLNAWPTREAAIRENIKSGKSAARGLAATGKGYAAIHLLCEVPGDHHKEVNSLIKEGVDVNAGCYQAGFTSGEVFTPLLLAISKGNTKIARSLVAQQNIKLDCKNRHDHTPLLAACRQGNVEVVKAILDRSSAVPKEYPDNWYGNLLMDAARHCELAIVELLLSRKLFDVNKTDSWGKSALMYAIIKTDVPSGTDRARADRARMLSMRPTVVRMLLDHNADVNLADKKGNTASTYARLEDDQELIEAVGTTRFELAETVPRHALTAQLGP